MLMNIKIHHPKMQRKCPAKLKNIQRVKSISEAQLMKTIHAHLKHHYKNAKRSRHSPKSSSTYAFQNVKCFTKLISFRVGIQAV